MSRQVLSEWIAKAEMRTESGEVWVLNYFLLEFDGEDNAPVYGMRVEKSTTGGLLHEAEETPPITDNRDDALAMIKTFAKGSVPPVTLFEMTDEWVSEVAEESLLLTN